jgi:hypothetical protein
MYCDNKGILGNERALPLVLNDLVRISSKYGYSCCRPPEFQSLDIRQTMIQQKFIDALYLQPLHIHGFAFSENKLRWTLRTCLSSTKWFCLRYIHAFYRPEAFPPPPYQQVVFKLNNRTSPSNFPSRESFQILFLSSPPKYKSIWFVVTVQLPVSTSRLRRSCLLSLALLFSFRSATNGH